MESQRGLLKEERCYLEQRYVSAGCYNPPHPLTDNSIILIHTKHTQSSYKYHTNKNILFTLKKMKILESSRN